jgi:hypothetical protein
MTARDPTPPRESPPTTVPTAAPRSAALWPLEDLPADGFSATEYAQGLPALALGSVRVGLKTYVATYRAMRYQLHLFDAASPHGRDVVEFNHPPDFAEAAMEALLHFQHFAELAVRGFLVEDHPLLGLNLSGNPVALHKLLHGESLTPDEQESGPNVFVGFGDLLGRVADLSRAGRISDPRLTLVVQHLPMLRKLNTLRNRLWHRGRFVPLYPALDKFVGGYVLPFAVAITQLPEYAGLRRHWKYQPLACGVDPIELIAADVGGGRYDVGKVALLKELARAAYANPLFEKEYARHNETLRRRAERLAHSHELESGTWSIESCPVCATDALALFDDMEIDGEDPETGQAERAWRYVWQVECLCCSFKITRDEIENPSIYGLPIADFWHAKQL